jgi:biopolymer transport protein ExbD
MAIQFNQGNDSDEVISKINTTPLVDVMLVLMIIFLITIPAVNSSVPLKLPKEVNIARDPQSKSIVVSVDAKGQVYWMDLKLNDMAALDLKLKELAQQNPQPELHFQGDAKANFESVGKVLLQIQNAGLDKVGFITETPAKQ